MRSCSLPGSIERARPLLGTVVAVRVHGVTERRAHGAIERAFAAISEIQRLMSFQEAASDVSRINRDAARAPLTVHRHTYRVLTWAARIAQASDGIFDASVAGQLVQWGILAAPPAAPPADPSATFRDVELLSGGRVRLRRPLWLDLSGIAKGYAVDRAIAALAQSGITQACVNAGGDLRILGAHAERVALRSAVPHADSLAMIEIAAGALATSSGHVTRRRHANRWVSSHVAGDTRHAIDARTTVSVLASRCVVADALTKVVLAEPHRGAKVLGRFGAGAYIHHPDYPGSGWKALGAVP
jgi:thiamine biosynthesis lipoprotein